MLKDQVDNLQKILELLEDDQSPTSKWASIASQKTLQQSKVALMELKAMLDAPIITENSYAA